MCCLNEVRHTLFLVVYLCTNIDPTRLSARQYLCFACTWGSAMDKAGLGSCVPCCLFMTCFPQCAICKGGMDTASKYGIEEGCCSACMKTCCCPACYKWQIQHEIMVKQGLHFGCMMLEVDGGAPVVTEMQR